jgi:F0F1-type ATP synthase assembly protein I
MTPKQSGADKTPGSYMRQFALATELPFVLVSGALVGGFLGYLLDRWWHTKPLMMFILGAAGFAASVRDVLRRLQQSDDSDSQSKPGN